MLIIKEFKKFAVRGNAIDMAVGIIIGAAFTKIVDSLVKDMLMPPLGMMLGKVDFSNLAITLKAKTAATTAVTINYGQFINTIIDFLIVSVAIFILVKQINKLTPNPTEKTKTCPYCISLIPTKAIRCPSCTSTLN